MRCTHSILVYAFFLALALSPLTLHAADQHTQHKPASSSGSMAMPTMVESGQATFGALIEIIEQLEADPETDWGTVNIDQLHSHLLQMNRLMRDTVAETVVANNEVQYLVSPKSDDQAVLEAIHTMAIAHARFIQHSRSWKIVAEPTPSGASITINTQDNALTTKLKALGFYGFMALDSHHQAHHYQLALGHGHGH